MKELKERKAPMKSVILISPCCGKGYGQAVKLIKELNLNGLVYNFVVQNAKNCVQVLEKFGIDPKTVKKIPLIYIDDLLFEAVKINDDEYVKKLISDLKLTNKDWKNKIVKKGE